MFAPYCPIPVPLPQCVSRITAAQVTKAKKTVVDSIDTIRERRKSRKSRDIMQRRKSRMRWSWRRESVHDWDYYELQAM